MKTSISQAPRGSVTRFLNLELRSLFLLISLLAFYILVPVLETERTGELVLAGGLALVLTAAALEVSERNSRLLIAVLVAAGGIAFHVIGHFIYRTSAMKLTSGLATASFLGFVVANMLRYLGRPGAITKARLYVSVSLYFLLGIIWFALYRIANLAQPGSFAEAGATLSGTVPPSKFLYFSLVTLTTLGYGDIVPVRPFARSLATLEAAAGILYIAITVARLVAAYQSAPRE